MVPHAAEAELLAKTTLGRLQALHNKLDALQAEQAGRQHLFHLRRGEGVAQADTPPVPNNKVAQPMQRILSIDLIRPGPALRHDFADAELDELAASIRRQGILQPMLVRPFPGNPTVFELVAGSRRWRAAQRAELHELPVIVREASDAEALEIALVENLQREDLSPLEEARAYKRLLAARGCTLRELASALGRSEAHVSNMTRLLQLPERVLQPRRESPARCTGSIRSDCRERRRHRPPSA
jgi:ParB family chromosome partitioning protein